MIQQACLEWSVDLEKSFLIGDMQRDIDAARAAGIPGYLFSYGNLYEFILNILHRVEEWLTKTHFS
jgi:D-glycero-D-manno-heptose 1,7-bisphosphate phosphatase